MKTTIRKAKQNDAETLFEIQIQTWLATYTYGEITSADLKERFSNRDERIKRWENWIDSQNEALQISVAVLNDQVVGYCTATKNQEYNEIRAIYISPNQQGKGIGKQLFDHAEEWLNKNPQKIRVYVANFNIGAQKFYEHLGFHHDASIKEHIMNLPNEKSITSIAMIKG